NMRDPVIYRVLHENHPRTGDAWCIYPTYDFAHGQSDAIEGVTHSLCTLEFADHRPLYDWLVAHLPTPGVPRQTEFARLNLTYTVLSKRKLMQLVQDGIVDGWDDPRMPTLKALRRRGFPAAAVREFAKGIGVARADSVVEYEYLEACAREVLNKTALRRMAVLNPLKVVIENYPEEGELLDAVNNPENEADGMRQVAFSREIYIERDDFMEDAPKKFFRLSPGKEVRLRYAYFITCTDVIKDDNGEIVELRATYDPASSGGESPDGRKVRGTLHWVDARSHRTAEVRRYKHLFTSENPAAEEDFLAVVNPDSKSVIEALIEPALAEDPVGTQVQFERLGYFCVDADAAPERPVFNEIVALRDSWKKIQKAQG
ncbi:MAG: glutamine--tRNA ligase, partial [Pseudomonadota bacterium]